MAITSDNSNKIYERRIPPTRNLYTPQTQPAWTGLAERRKMEVDYVLQGDCRKTLKQIPDKSVDCCVTSPPYYGLRDYGTGTWIGGDPNCPHARTSKFNVDMNTGQIQDGLVGMIGDSIYKSVCPLCGAVREDNQIGLEESPEEYVSQLVSVFREIKRVLKDNGTLWLNIGDSYWGSGSRGFDFTGKFTETSARQNGSKGTINMSNIPKLVGNVDGYKNKDLIGIPWMLAFALRDDGWYLRQDIIWSKPNPMPESVKDRCTKSHEYIFLLSKSRQYYFDHEAIQEEATGYDGKKDTMLKGSQKYADSSYMPNNSANTMSVSGNERWRFKNLQDKGQTTHSMHERRADGEKDILYPARNKRDVWIIPTKPVKEAHFATFPEKLIEPCVLAGCPIGGVVLDPFFGSGTTGRVATKLGRHYIGCELNSKYIDIADKRTNNVQLSFVGMI